MLHAALPYDGMKCASRNDVLRRQHSLDRDGKCFFCDLNCGNMKLSEGESGEVPEEDSLMEA